MTSNKALATLFLITLSMQRAAASSSGSAQESSSSGKLVPRASKQGPAPKPKEITPVLKDIGTVRDVEVPGSGTEMMSTSQEQPAPQVSELDDEENRSSVIEYGRREMIHDGIKREPYSGGEKSRRMVEKERPTKFVGGFPDTDEALDALLAKFPTKKDLEERWVMGNADSTSPSGTQKP